MNLSRFLISGFLSLVLILTAGCSKHMKLSAQDSKPSTPTTNASDPAPAPFAKNDAKPDPAKPAADVVLPAGTPLTVRLQNSVSSSTSAPGDRFDAVLDHPVVIDGQTIAPEGARVSGRVVAVRRSGHLWHPGYLRIALASITIDGKAMPVDSSSITLVGRSHKRRNLAWIGGGAGGGALIGALAGGGQGALIGSAIGAAGGTTTAFATGKKDVGFSVERRLTFRLVRPLTIA